MTTIPDPPRANPTASPVCPHVLLVSNAEMVPYRVSVGTFLQESGLNIMSLDSKSLEQWKHGNLIHFADALIVLSRDDLSEEISKPLFKALRHSDNSQRDWIKQRGLLLVIGPSPCHSDRILKFPVIPNLERLESAIDTQALLEEIRDELNRILGLDLSPNYALPDPEEDLEHHHDQASHTVTDDHSPLFWSGHVLDLAQLTFDFLEDFPEALEAAAGFPMLKDRFVLTLPVHFRDLSFVESLEQLNRKMVEIDGPLGSINDLSRQLERVPRVTVRATGDLDYRVPQDLPDELRNLQNQSAKSLLLIYKNIKQKGTLHINELLKKLVDCFIPKPEEFVSPWQNLVRAYGLTLEKTLFRCLNELRQAANHYEQQCATLNLTAEMGQRVQQWQAVYRELMYNLVAKLDVLNIELIEPERGQAYDHNYHNPFVEAEPDPELEDFQIKEVVNLGFQARDLEGPYVFKAADVVVVKNEFR